MDENKPVATRSFLGGSGAEHFIAVTAPAGFGFVEQLDQLRRRYAEARRALGLGPETAVFRRVFVSDAMNQTAALRASDLVACAEDGPVAVSIVQQPPLPEAKVALLAYHVEGAAPVAKRRLSPNHVLVEKGVFAICGALGSAPVPTVWTFRRRRRRAGSSTISSPRSPARLDEDQLRPAGLARPRSADLPGPADHDRRLRTAGAVDSTGRRVWR